MLIVGFGAFGATAGRFLNANGVATTVLDRHSDRVGLLRRLGLEVDYGDAIRHDLLRTAGAGHARLLADLRTDDADRDRGWDPETLREEARGGRPAPAPPEEGG